MKNVPESIILSTRRAVKTMFAWLLALVHVFRRGTRGKGRVPRCAHCRVRDAREHYTRIAWRRHACRSCWRELVRVGDARAVRAVRANLAGISSRHALALARLADECDPGARWDGEGDPLLWAVLPLCDLGRVVRFAVGVGPDPYNQLGRRGGALGEGHTTVPREETSAGATTATFSDGAGEIVDHPIPYGLTREGRAAARAAGCTCKVCSSWTEWQRAALAARGLS